MKTHSKGKNKVDKLATTMWIFLAAVVVLVGGVATGVISLSSQSTTVFGGSSSDNNEVSVESFPNCDQSGQADLTLDLRNILNDTGSETFDAGLVYKSEGDPIGIEISDTTSNTISNLACGKYTIELKSTGAAGGDTAIIYSASGKPSDIQLQEDENGYERILSFTHDGDGTLSIKGAQMGAIEARAKNVNTGNFLDEDGGTDSTSGAYTSDGTDWESETNGTDLAIAQTDDVELDIDFRTTNVDQEFSDIGGFIIGVTAAPSIYGEPTLEWEGEVLTEGVSQLNEFEQDAIRSSYDFFYVVEDRFNNPADPKKYVKTLKFKINAEDGEPTTAHDLEFDLIPRGVMEDLSEENKLIVSAYDDAGNLVHASGIMDFGVAVS